ncbi:drug resistance transporter, EmrB/QacA subfamily [Tsukamurella pulmonis]|uniref:Drug resistance transporter, EmrB/QacA subfamily n=1 Tax=Tsukamurella pulmonis TaxID=47312 RepID=A0A1H1HL18_9ACTN|nr:DHA2 family efflux MFS transporter permease subunit [Tsukamurella pulmonis]SDR26073.1 drug resistance transporter, EmrB/QacA subfamily [Tsukamurella pulmonis]SUP14172.1 High-copy suppressor of rspA [Tsukamurella pulmonis]
MRTSTPVTTPVSADRWPALGALALGYVMILVDATALSVVTVRLMEGLHTDVRSVLWVSSAYLLAFAVPMLLCGRLGDRFGHRRMYLLGLTVFVLASLACGLAPTLGVLVALRVVQGFGAALMTPQVMAIITLVFPMETRGAALGVWGAITGIATLAGPLLGGVLTEFASWRWVFWLNVPVGLAGIVMTLRYVPRSVTTSRRLDLPGSVLSAAAVLGLILGLQESGRPGAAPWLALAAGGTGTVVFLVWQRRRGDGALVPLRLFRIRSFAASSGVNLLAGAWVTAYVFPATLYAQARHGVSPGGAALLLAPTALVSALLAPRVGRSLRRRDPRGVLSTGLAVCGLGLGLFVVVVAAEMPPGWLVLPASVVGVGSAMMWGPLSLLATSELPRDLVGAGAGAFNTARQLGSAFGAAAVAAVLAHGALSGALALAAGICLAALAAAAALRS